MNAAYVRYWASHKGESWRAYRTRAEAGQQGPQLRGQSLRRRGEGYVFRKPDSACWWLAYCVNGKRVRESAHTTSRTLALKLLRAEALTARPRGRATGATR